MPTACKWLFRASWTLCLVSEDLDSMNPCCLLVSILCLFKNKSNLLYINFSRGLENTNGMDIGL